MKARSQASFGSGAEGKGVEDEDVKHIIQTSNLGIKHSYSDLPLNYMNDSEIQISFKFGHGKADTSRA